MSELKTKELPFEKEFPFNIDHSKCLLCQDGLHAHAGLENDPKFGGSHTVDGEERQYKNHICQTCQWHAFEFIIQEKTEHKIRLILIGMIEEFDDNLYADELTVDQFKDLLEKAQPNLRDIESRTRNKEMLEFIERIQDYYNYYGVCRKL